MFSKLALTAGRRFRHSINVNLRAASISKSILDALPQASNTDSAWTELRRELKNDPSRLIVLDDDPTGSQTVYDVNVLLDYSVESIVEQLEKDEKLFYILTNTRSMTTEQAQKVTKTILENIEYAQSYLHYIHPLQLISRSDSTLRGHYPAETNLMLKPMRMQKTIICPAFFDGGRVTLNDTHYIVDGEVLTPVGETPFSKDPYFGYKNSNLRDWIEEKTNGEISREEVVSVSLDDIRLGGVEGVMDRLENTPIGATIIVNAVNQHDLNTFVLGLLRIENDTGAQFIYRTAASFVASRAGLEPKRLLDVSPKKLPPGKKRSGGLVVVGSYVPKTTAQLDILLRTTNVFGVELDVAQIVAASEDEDALSEIVESAAREVNYQLHLGRDVVIHTSRKYVETSVMLDTAVSKVVSDIVERVVVKPSFIIAKGGITSHEVAQNGLFMSVARVLGQVEPGVSVWRAGEESRFPDLNYVVFPGNVGDEQALARVAMKLGVSQREYRESAAVGYNSSNVNSATLLDTLKSAQSGKKAIAAFNIYNFEGAKAVVAAAEQTQSPVILQVHPVALQFGGPPLIEMLRAFKRHATVPIYLSLDHAEQERDIDTALRCGVDSVMVDGSALDFEENVAWTKKMVSWIHSSGAVAEGELGRLAGEEDGLSVALKKAKMTDPQKAARFVNDTKVDLLAVTIGNVHGEYAQPPQLDLTRLDAIVSAIPAQTPLVLHGASGLSAQWISDCTARGVCKFNVNTDLRRAALQYQKGVFNSSAEVDTLQLMNGSAEEMTRVAVEKIRLFNGSNIM